MATYVPTSEYRRHLRAWHERVRRGEEVVVTDKGAPVVRVVAAEAEDLVDRLARQGLLRRGRPRRPAAELPAIPAPGDSGGVVADARER